MIFNIYINSAAYHHCAPDWSWDQANFNDYDLWIVWGGHGNITVNGSRYELIAGDCFLFRPGMSAAGRQEPANPLRITAIHFDYVTGSVAQNEPLQSILRRRFSNLDFIQGLATRITSKYLQGDQEAARAWLSVLLREFAEAPEVMPLAGPRLDYQQLALKLCERITAKPAYAWKVSAMAKSANLSADHFTRIFREFTSMSPRAFVSRIRIEYAKNLLSASNHTVAEVAEKAGFGDIFTFSKQFKKKVGVTPSQFRQPTEKTNLRTNLNAR